MPDGLAGTFAEALGRLIGDGIAADRLGIAVSGGPDSMALLDLAMTACPNRVEAATVDHGLRPEAADEAAMVATWCAAHDIPHAILHPPVPITGSVQAEARAVRYRLLDGWMAARGLDWLLTAHHADDQLETVLMRLNRASGVAGLAGIRARRGYVVRPLLGVRKDALLDHVRDRAIPFVQDPSNGDARFDRVRLRGSLAGADWLDPEAAAASAAALGDAEAALAWSVERLIADHVVREGDVMRLTDTDLPREYLRRILGFMVSEMAPEARIPRGEALDQAIVQLCHGNKISIGACIGEGGATWTVRRAPPRREPN